jgi:protein TonB
MRASTTYLNGGSKITKIAIVTALHLAVALALINMKAFKPAPPPFFPGVITPPTVVEPPPPPDVTDNTPKKVEPTLFKPETEIVVEQKPLEPAPYAKPLPPGPVAEPEKTVAGKPDGAVAKPVDKIAAKPYNPASVGDCARPDYPARAARNGDSGTVTLALLIGADGKVADAKVNRSSGFKDLDRAAVSALSLCKFKPATNNGVPESAWGQIAYVWSLE